MSFNFTYSNFVNEYFKRKNSTASMARDAILTFDKMDKAFQAEIQATMRRRLKHPTTFDKGVYERLTIDRKEWWSTSTTTRQNRMIPSKKCKGMGVHILFESTRKTLDLSVGNPCIASNVYRLARPLRGKICVAFAAIGTPTAAFSVDVQYASSRQSVEDKTFIIQTTETRCERTSRVNWTGKQKFTIPSTGTIEIKVRMKKIHPQPPQGIFSIAVATDGGTWHSPPFVHYKGTPANSPTLENICIHGSRLHFLAHVAHHAKERDTIGNMTEEETKHASAIEDESSQDTLARSPRHRQTKKKTNPKQKGTEVAKIIRSDVNRPGLKTFFNPVSVFFYDEKQPQWVG